MLVVTVHALTVQDNVELAVARSGQTADPSAGRQDMAAMFGDDAPYRFGYLTQQSAAWAVLGVNFGSKFSPASLTKDDDAMFVVRGCLLRGCLVPVLFVVVVCQRCVLGVSRANLANRVQQRPPRRPKHHTPQPPPPHRLATRRSTHARS